MRHLYAASFLAILALTAAAPARERLDLVFRPVYFAPGSTAIGGPCAPCSGTGNEAILIGNAMQIAVRDDITIVVLEGHADAREADAEPLARRRVELVRDELLARGVPPAKLEVQIVGAAQPAFPGDDEAARMFNRRVEFVPYR